jgi:ATP-dependent RNA helicase SUPV3L1/SUV3
MAGYAPRVRAVHGPTNTGKTHLAIERLLAHASGIIGFPLRLLARENYDRMVAAKGVRHVALITGEEKIVPPGARWFSCTVEAMPLDRHVEFVAVDEIQLCADPDRGHVFTERLLHARGLVETMFLGAETIRRRLAALVPGIEIETRPRLSQLHYTGAAKLSRLPPRSAVVAFSAAEVYAIAEAIRRRRGGCAVVMGRLSPRTRNAQVALYQDKEVDFLVATDAIGMGLNMDVNHVGFASLNKFDGRRPRPLLATELAQIAGRAGRGMRDGTFGTIGGCPPIPPPAAEAVEQHRFDPLTHLFWRNTALDFSGLDSLLASLAAAPPGPGLVRGPDSSDLETLGVLARDAEILRLASHRSRVKLLWEACQIPDFRKLADESHARLCAKVFAHVVNDKTLPESWLRSAIDGLGGTMGDIDTLMQRLSGVRVWAYITARQDWVRESAEWQARTRAIEDKLSDALHDRLIARFVDRRAAKLSRQLQSGEALLSAVTRQGEVVVEGHLVGHVAGFGFVPDTEAESESRKLMLRAARRALREEMPRLVAACVASDDSAFAWREDNALLWQGYPVGRLRRGATPLSPAAEPQESEFLDGRQREQLRARLQAFAAQVVKDGLSPLFRAAESCAADAALRGPAHWLREGLGIAAPVALDAALRARLKANGVCAGRFALFMPVVLKPGIAVLRARLLALWHGVPVSPPAAGRAALPLAGLGDNPLALGFMAAGAWAVRLDIAERIAAELAQATRCLPAALPPGLASRLSIPAAALPAVLRALGFMLIPAPVWQAHSYGPPSPVMVAAKRRKPFPAAAAVAEPHAGPFAALAAMRRRVGA